MSQPFKQRNLFHHVVPAGTKIVNMTWKTYPYSFYIISLHCAAYYIGAKFFT